MVRRQHDILVRPGNPRIRGLSQPLSPRDRATLHRLRPNGDASMRRRSRRGLIERYSRRTTGFLAGCAAAMLVAAAGHAQTDEIQVYDAEINPPGQFSLQLHNNYTPIGRKEPDFPGGIVPNHTLNGVPEWALEF